LPSPGHLDTIAFVRNATYVFALLLLGSAATSAAAPLAVGMAMPAIMLADQHDQQGSVGPDTRCVVFSRDMGGKQIVQEALANDPAPLAAAGAVVVSDISAMPSVITHLFALPAMRKRPYRMLLDRQGKQTADIPSMSGQVTVLHLRALTVERVEYVGSPEALRAALGEATEQSSSK